MNQLKDIEYQLELIWNDYHRSRMYKATSPFMPIKVGDDITFPESSGDRVNVVSVRHFLGDHDSNSQSVIHRVLVHVETLVPVDTE